MPTFVLIHGAYDSPFYWHLLAAELTERGHEVIAPSLPSEDESAGLWDYADTVVEAVGDRRDLVLVAQSFGAFTAPLVCARLPVELLVFVAGLVPVPGETGEEWWDDTGYPGPAREAEGGDTVALFYQDVPPAIAAEALQHGRGQAAKPTRERWPLSSWPPVPTRFLACREDRLLPLEWIRGVVQDRLGITADEIDGGHCPALSRPKELADRLESYWGEL